MDEQSKKGHLYASKIMLVILLAMLAFALLGIYAPMLLLWSVATFFAIVVFAGIYNILYELGRDK